MAQQPRTIQPGDAADERLAAVSLSAAYTYAYLPTVMDDAGRVKDQPKVLNGYLWPLRADDHPSAAMEDDLAALTDAGLLCRYTVDRVAHLHDPEWRRRQERASSRASELPACPVHDRPFDDAVSETLSKVSEQVNAFLGSAGGIDQDQIRDTVGRLVEDVTFLVDPEKAATFGQKVREFLGDPLGSADQTSPVEHVDVEQIDPSDDAADAWGDVTDDPRD